MATEESIKDKDLDERQEVCLSDFFKNDTLTDMALRNPTSKGNIR